MKRLTPKIMASPSFSNCEQFFFAGVSVLETYAIGCSVLSFREGDTTAPCPYCDTSRARINGLVLW